jgi:hypothetical protein
MRYLIIFLFLATGCSNKEKMLENCSDDMFKVSAKYVVEFVKLADGQKLKNPFDAIGPIDKKKYKYVLDEKKLNKFLSLNLKKKLELREYLESFQECVEISKNTPDYFKAKYK